MPERRWKTSIDHVSRCWLCYVWKQYSWIAREKLEDEKEYEVVGDLSELQPKEEAEQPVTNGSKSQNGGDNLAKKGGLWNFVFCFTLALLRKRGAKPTKGKHLKTELARAR